MHPNWNLMRKPWIAAVNACVSPRDLGRALSVLAACIRPVAFTQVCRVWPGVFCSFS